MENVCLLRKQDKNRPLSVKPLVPSGAPVGADIIRPQQAGNSVIGWIVNRRSGEVILPFAEHISMLHIAVLSGG